MSSKPKCPTCRKTVPTDSKHKPFCSSRCQDVDLGAWLSEGYRISRPMTPWEMARVYEPGDGSNDDGPS